jgi:hypothetical protein
VPAVRVTPVIVSALLIFLMALVRGVHNGNRDTYTLRGFGRLGQLVAILLLCTLHWHFRAEPLRCGHCRPFFRFAAYFKPL